MYIVSKSTVVKFIEFTLAILRIYTDIVPDFHSLADISVAFSHHLLTSGICHVDVVIENVHMYSKTKVRRNVECAFYDCLNTLVFEYS